jgi:hypothetical protein
LCGAARYRIERQPLAVNACHCIDCKRSSGGTHAIFLHVKRENLVHEQGELARYRKTADSGREIDIARCAACGTRLWHEPLAAPELAFVAAGTLDDPSWAMPTSHIWTSRMTPGVMIEADALVYEGAPPDRQAIWDRFGELYPGLA